LVQKAAGLFIFASTICKVINEGDLEEELKQVAKLPTDKEGCLGIDDLYQQVVKTALKNMSKEDVLCKMPLNSRNHHPSPKSTLHC